MNVSVSRNHGAVHLNVPRRSLGWAHKTVLRYSTLPAAVPPTCYTDESCILSNHVLLCLQLYLLSGTQTTRACRAIPLLLCLASLLALALTIGMYCEIQCTCAYTECEPHSDLHCAGMRRRRHRAASSKLVCSGVCCSSSGTDLGCASDSVSTWSSRYTCLLPVCMVKWAEFLSRFILVPALGVTSNS